MKKILLAMILLVVFSFANSNQNNSFIKELGLTDTFLDTPSFKLKYRDLSSNKKLSYYDNLLKKHSLNTNIVREKIEKEALPSFIFFIPLIESSYINQATKGPSGLWQIMPLTANNLKLTRNEFVDERLDLLKATNAATKYLKKYYEKTKKWYLAIASYNAGEGRIMSGVARASLDKYLEKNPNMYHDKVIKLYNLYIHDYKKNKKGVHNLYTIYKDIGIKHGYFDYEYLVKHNNKRDYFPKTTINYINSIVAFEKLANSNKFKNLDRKTKYELENVNIPKGLDIKNIALSLDMNQNELQNINKHLLKGVVPNSSKNYNFYIPHTKLSLFESKVSSMKTSNEVQKQSQKEKKTSNKNSITHIVQKGDNFSSIAKRYKTSIKKLKNDNNKKTDSLKIGEKIEIYK